MKYILSVFIAVPVVLSCLALPANALSSEELSNAMSRHLNCLPLQSVVMDEQEISISKEKLCLAAVYVATGMKPLWVSERGPGENAAVILQFLENSRTEGLRPSDYAVQDILSLWKSRNSDDLARLDTLLTINLIKYAHDVSRGRLMPFKGDPQLFAEASDRHFKPVQIIKRVLAAQDLASHLAYLPPSHEYYRKLREALKEYRDIAAAGNWEKVADGKMLHPGDRDERLEQVRKRLEKKGGTEAGGEKENSYDDQLVLKVKQFQKSFGLEGDGIIGPKTLAALNRSPEEIVDTIILNMARWRWLNIELGRRYILVNIANYELMAVEEGRRKIEMPVIVGKQQHQTPVFSRRIQYVDINPFWNIPSSIAANEELPELRKDQFYLADRKVRVFSSWEDNAVELDSTAIDWQAVSSNDMKRYKLRQDPGPWNALGKVKFVFPNEYSVYIHGTPAQELFENNIRDFSHGCIRASRPLALAEFLLSEEKQEWPLVRIQEIADMGERTVVRLSDPVAVHITYQTAWFDNSGEINFNSDVYGRDRRLAEILFATQDSVTSTDRDFQIDG
ncbi:MAG: L,D-transpeptidase family protein [Thermodesulfobacteriota bacterium]